MEDITDTGYTYAERFFEYFQINILGECYDSYVQSDTLLSADAFESL